MAVVLIAGASKGIGLEIAKYLQIKGHQIFGTSRNPELTAVGAVSMLPLDITRNESVQECVNYVIDAAGRVDVLINNAGYDLYGAAEDTTLEELIAQMDTNFLGAVRLTQSVLPHLRRQGGGKIINMSSLGGLVSLPFNSAYSASKFALEGYSESLRYELLPFNIFVSLIEPGQVRTDTLGTSIRSTQRSSIHYPTTDAAAQARAAGQVALLTPAHIARQVSRIIATPQPRLRYRVGNQAHLVFWLKTLLPSRVFEPFILRQFVASHK
jgi:short-subunit dehydrogenase